MNIKKLFFVSLLLSPQAVMASEPSLVARAISWVRAFIQADIDARTQRLSSFSIDHELEQAAETCIARVNALRFYAERDHFRGDPVVVIYKDASKQEMVRMVLVTRKDRKDMLSRLT